MLFSLTFILLPSYLQLHKCRHEVRAECWKCNHAKARGSFCSRVAGPVASSFREVSACVDQAAVSGSRCQTSLAVAAVGLSILI
eukprot:SAG31_NODE_15636_length_745_cov_1.160991_1_plen_83_part_10